MFSCRLLLYFRGTFFFDLAAAQALTIEKTDFFSDFFFYGCRRRTHSPLTDSLICGKHNVNPIMPALSFPPLPITPFIRRFLVPLAGSPLDAPYAGIATTFFPPALSLSFVTPTANTRPMSFREATSCRVSPSHSCIADSGVAHVKPRFVVVYIPRLYF